MSVDKFVPQADDALVFSLLDWLDNRQRTYEEVVEAWHASCAHRPVWEEANSRGFVMRESSNGTELVHLTSIGAAALRNHRFLEIMRNYLKVAS
jgi:hypothetical protein